MSRVTSADLVTMPTGWFAADSTSRICRITLHSPLDRLVGIGVGADRDGARLVAGRRQLPFEQPRGVRLHEELRFEIEARRQAHIGVRRPREAVGAAVLAAAIGIDRAVEGNVRRLVARDDLSGALDLHLGLQRRQLFERTPVVVERLDDLRLVAAGNIGLRAAPAPAIAQDIRLRRPGGPPPAQAGPGRRAFGETMLFLTIQHG